MLHLSPFETPIENGPNEDGQQNSTIPSQVLWFGLIDHVMRSQAEKYANPGKQPLPKTIPSDLRGAADYWLGHERRRMAKGSFKVLPSRIAYLVTLLGASTPLESVSAHDWKRWTDWLRKQVRTEKMAQKTAEIIYARARQFLRFMVGKKKVKDWDSLAVSAAAALA